MVEKDQLQRSRMEQTPVTGRSGLQHAYCHAHSPAAGLLIGTRVVTSPAGFKGESRGRGAVRAPEPGGEVGVTARVAGPEGRRGRAVDGGKGAERAVPRRPRCGAWGAGVRDQRKAGPGASRGVGKGGSPCKEGSLSASWGRGGWVGAGLHLPSQRPHPNS